MGIFEGGEHLPHEAHGEPHGHEAAFEPVGAQQFAQ